MKRNAKELENYDQGVSKSNIGNKYKTIVFCPGGSLVT